MDEKICEMKNGGCLAIQRKISNSLRWRRYAKGGKGKGRRGRVDGISWVSFDGLGSVRRGDGRWGGLICFHLSTFSSCVNTHHRNGAIECFIQDKYIKEIAKGWVISKRKSVCGKIEKGLNFKIISNRNENTTEINYDKHFSCDVYSISFIHSSERC